MTTRQSYALSFATSLLDAANKHKLSFIGIFVSNKDLAKTLEAIPALAFALADDMIEYEKENPGAKE